jgi:hypothetical protein
MPYTVWVDLRLNYKGPVAPLNNHDYTPYGLR